MPDPVERPEDELRRAEEMLAAIKEGVANRRRVIQPNECPGCGAFRIDGKAPQIHERDCPVAP